MYSFDLISRNFMFTRHLFFLPTFVWQQNLHQKRLQHFSILCKNISNQEFLFLNILSNYYKQIFFCFIFHIQAFLFHDYFFNFWYSLSGFFFSLNKNIKSPLLFFLEDTNFDWIFLCLYQGYYFQITPSQSPPTFCEAKNFFWNFSLLKPFFSEYRKFWPAP